MADRAAFWTEFLHFLQYAETAVRFLAVPTAEIFARCPAETAGAWVKACTNRCANGIPMPTVWQSTVAEQHKLLRFSAEERAFLLQFGEGFGASDGAGQQAHFAFFIAQTAERLKNAQTEKHQKGRLWLMLGALGGIGLDILLI